VHFVKVSADLLHRDFESVKQGGKAVEINEVLDAECMPIGCSAILISPSSSNSGDAGFGTFSAGLTVFVDECVEGIAGCGHGGHGLGSPVPFAVA
jgi:hypothetical protein